MDKRYKNFYMRLIIGAGFLLAILISSIYTAFKN